MPKLARSLQPADVYARPWPQVTRASLLAQVDEIERTDKSLHIEQSPEHYESLRESVRKAWPE